MIESLSLRKMIFSRRSRGCLGFEGLLGLLGVRRRRQSPLSLPLYSFNIKIIITKQIWFILYFKNSF